MANFSSPRNPGGSTQRRRGTSITTRSSTRCSMFLGLSDGAHMDFFRRQNRELSNEQVFVHYDFSKSKAKDMIENLKKDTSIQETA